MDELFVYCEKLARNARTASRALAVVNGSRKNRWLERTAAALDKRVTELLEANVLDIHAAPDFGLSPAQIDRLRLTPERLRAMADSLRAVAALPDPAGRVIEGSIRPNGLSVQKVYVPLGVILFIYESRPNVTMDAASLCLKSGNAVILRGGKEAHHSNQALHSLIRDNLREAELPIDAVQMVETPDREAVGHLLRQSDSIDVVIPRGGESLIRRVAAEARMPVIKHYRGNCHVYVDATADFDMAERIIINSKCQRPGVCNAAESLLVHKNIAARFLPRLGQTLRQKNVEIRGCPETRRWIPEAKQASDEDYAAEFLDLILSIKVVNNLDEAIEHIGRFGSQHSDAIVTNDLSAARRFTAEIDSSAVLVNASTRFNDGYELGLGAEIGISTDKFHARGPCGLLELMSYKYIIVGDGQIRS